MTSTHRRNINLMERCANEVGTSLERVKVCVCVYARMCFYMCLCTVYACFCGVIQYCVYLY